MVLVAGRRKRDVRMYGSLAVAWSTQRYHWYEARGIGKREYKIKRLIIK